MADELKSEETKTESVEQVKVEETQKEESKGFSQSELDEIVSIIPKMPSPIKSISIEHNRQLKETINQLDKLQGEDING